MFEQELSSLLDVVAYIDDAELRTELEESIKSTVRSLEYSRKAKAKEDAANEAGLCRFNEAWRGRCNQPSVNPAKTLCERHLGVMCKARGCTNHAILTCSDTGGAFCCGMPVCKKHTRHYEMGNHG